MKKFFNEKEKENEKKHEEIETGTYKQKSNANDIQSSNEIFSLRQDLE